jgi:hypothetical protein
MELDLGPQNPGDGPLIRRVRLHQSWYRAAVLGLTRWGSTRGRSAKELGSVLTDGAVAAGLNFGSPSAFRLYETRHSEGWGIDPRCSAYMTSSQAMTINLFGLLGQDDAWLLECLKTWLGRPDLRRVESVELEFAPARRSLHLNDQTRIDVLVVAAGDLGTEVIAVEVKYADRFNSRLVDISTSPYRELARRAGLWADAAKVLGGRRVNQLARVHALAASYSISLGVSAPASLLVLSHEMDASAADVVEEYRMLVDGPLVHHVHLRNACRSVVDAAPPRYGSAARDLDVRYGSEAGSASIARSMGHGSDEVSSAARLRPDSDRSLSPTR